MLLNVLQHDVENDENLTDDDYDLVSENKSESDNSYHGFEAVKFSKLVLQNNFLLHAHI